MDYNTGSLRAFVFWNLHHGSVMCRGCSHGLQGEEDPDNLSDRDNPDDLGESDDPDNQDISDEPDESSTDEESD